jgi:MFS family permease
MVEEQPPEAASARVDRRSGPAQLAGPTSDPTSQAPPPLRRNRDFRVFLAGQGVSAFGDAISFTALPLLVVALTGSGVAMGTVGALSTLPDLIFGLPAGALADRWDRRRMMLYADLGRAMLTALIPLSVFLGLDTMAVVLLVVAPINLLRVMFMAAFTAAVPNLVERHQIGAANGLVEGLFSVSFIVGPAIAGVLVGTIGAGPTLALDAASFLFSALALSAIHRPMRAARDPAAPPSHLGTDIVEGVRYILSERTLRMVIAFWGAVSVAMAPLVPAVIFFLRADLGRPESVIGLIVSSYGVGYLIGAIVAGRSARGRLGLMMIAGNLLSGLMLVGFAFAGTPLLEAVTAAGSGAFGAITLVSYVTLRATIPPNELLGRVGSTARMISLGLQPVGLLIGGILLDSVRGQVTLLSIAGVVIALTLLFALSPAIRAAVPGTGRRP